jgi:thioredoxin reductase (NADPH)
LSAAVYGALEGLRTLLLEPQALGGQAGTSSLIRNYLGFPGGISGMRLAQSAAQQAQFFGAITVFDAVMAMRTEGEYHVLVLENGAEVLCRAVVIATGVAYRRLDVPVLEALVGAGVFYGAATLEAPALREQEAFVVVAGNFAGQAALHLAQYAKRVTMLVRGESLTASMSDYLIKQLEATDNVVVRTQIQVVDGGGRGRLEWIAVEDPTTHGRERLEAGALFVLIEAGPRRARSGCQEASRVTRPATCSPVVMWANRQRQGRLGGSIERRDCWRRACRGCLPLATCARARSYGWPRPLEKARLPSGSSMRH